MSDTELEERLRHDLHSEERAPSFEHTWTAAELRYRRGRRRNAALAGLAATLAAVAIIVNALMPEQDQVVYIEMAELLETTSWQAPSDVLLPAREFDIYQDLPALMESTEEVGGALL